MADERRPVAGHPGGAGPPGAMSGGLHTRRWGPADAPILMLLHGLTDDGTAWPDAVRRWRDRYRIVAVDLRGHGRSPRFDDEQLRRSSQVWLTDVLDILRTLDEPPVIVGHSLGGLLALRAADTEPGLVRALVLEDPAQPTGHTAPDPDFVAHQEEFLDRFSDGGAAEIARMHDETAWSTDEIDAWAACKPLVDRRMIRDALVLGAPEWEAVFDRLAVPTLVLVPRGGPMAPDERLIGNPLVRIDRLDGVGHCIRRDDPDLYHGLVDPFLSETTASG